MKTIAPVILATLALAACNSEPAGDSDQVAATETPAASPTTAAPTAVASSQAAIGETIPTALQGKWGLVPADCEPGRADAKGLMTVGPTTLEFYESRGELADIQSSGENTLRATFGFMGEGMEWRRDMALETQEGDTELVRTEFGEDAMTEPLRYTKCG